MVPQARFTVYEPNVIPGGQVVRPPKGWKDMEIVLKRHEKLHSVIEYFEGTFLWYADARRLFRQIEIEVGPDAIIELVVEVMFRRGVWTTVFTGLIDYTMMQELTRQTVPYKQEIPIIPSDIKTTVMNRIKTPVNLLAAESLDGIPVTVEDNIVLPLPCQLIKSYYREEQSIDVAVNGFYMLPDTWLQVGFLDKIVKSDLKDAHIVPTMVLEAVPSEKFTALHAGSYTVDISLSFYYEPGVFTEVVDEYFTVYYQINEEAPVELTRTDVTLFAPNNFTTFTAEFTMSLLAGDTIRVYGRNAISILTVYAGGFGFVTDYIEIVADTEYPDSFTDSFLLKDALTNILRKLTGVDDILVSATLDSYKRLYTLQKILHVRGFTMDEKPFIMSLEEFVSGVFPALALGMGFNSSNQVVVEDVSYFYKISPSVTFTKLGEKGSITRRFSSKHFYKLVELGFDWSSETASGLNDAQTKKSYRLKFKTTGEIMNLVSTMYAASIGIEGARRESAEQGKDHRLDEKIALIAVKEDGLGGYTPEVGTDFASSTNIDNPDTKYNFRLFISRIFKRWQPFLQGCLEYYTGEKFYFAKGEGNSTASVRFNASDPEYRVEDIAGELAENADIEKGVENLILPNLYKAGKVSIKWDEFETIRNDPNSAIGLPYNKEQRSMYIQEFRYKLFGGYFNAELLETSPTAFDDYMLYEDGIIMAFEDGALMKYNS